MDNELITVLGGVNVDICGTSDRPPILHDSNPGRTGISFGGVGRNIAENLCLLGHRHVEMLTMLGDDLYSRELKAYSESIGISFKYSPVIAGEKCSTYLTINDPSGEMQLAVNDMRIYDRMNAEHISSRLELLNSSKLVIVDTNLPQEVLRYTAEHVKVPLVLDPVSTVKAVKVSDFIGLFDTVKPNIYEAELYTGQEIKDDHSLEKAGEWFISRGVRNVFISLGSKGVYYTNGHISGQLPAVSGISTVNTSGCGDSFLAAACHIRLQGGNIMEMALGGECAAAICASSPKTINPELSETALKKLMASCS